MQTRRGQSIEDESMEIIEREIGEHGYSAAEWPIVRRVIHSTADFDFAGRNAILFGNNAVQSGIEALKGGCGIVADVNGVAGLLNRQGLSRHGNTVVCRISETETARLARDNMTRSQVSMRRSAAELDGGIAVIGNAPTALLEVMAIAREGTARPALIIGMPVGFVCAAEAKEELRGSKIPHITNTGRKGGSPSAAAALNALLKIASAG